MGPTTVVTVDTATEGGLDITSSKEEGAIEALARAVCCSTNVQSRSTAAASRNLHRTSCRLFHNLPVTPSKPRGATTGPSLIAREGRQPQRRSKSRQSPE